MVLILEAGSEQGFVAGVRWVVRGKDAGSARIRGYGRDCGRRIAPPSAARRLNALFRSGL
jgi:hypothetical protein